VAIAAVFVRTNASLFADAPRNWFDWPTGVSSFVIYLASYIGFATSVTTVSEIVGKKFGEVWVDASYLALVITSAILAYFLGMWSLTSGISRIGMDWREIGYRTTSVGRDVVTGLAGFFAALPLLFVAAITASLLARTVFKNIPTPQQPIEGIVSSGNALGVVLAFLAALYDAARSDGSMGRSGHFVGYVCGCSPAAERFFADICFGQCLCIDERAHGVTITIDDVSLCV